MDRGRQRELCAGIGEGGGGGRGKRCTDRSEVAAVGPDGDRWEGEETRAEKVEDALLGRKASRDGRCMRESESGLGRENDERRARRRYKMEARKGRSERGGRRSARPVRGAGELEVAQGST